MKRGIVLSIIYTVEVSEIGEVEIPAVFIEKNGNNDFYIVPGINPCVQVYSEQEWQKLVLHVKDMPKYKQLRVRQIFAGAVRVALNEGKIAVPIRLCEQYNLITSEVVLIESDKGFEVWNKEIIDLRSADNEEQSK